MEEKITLAELTQKVKQHRTKLEFSFEKLGEHQLELITLKQELRTIECHINLLLYDSSIKGADSTSRKNLPQNASKLLERIEIQLQKAEKHLNAAHRELLISERNALQAISAADQTVNILDRIKTFLNQSQDEGHTAQELLDKADSLQERLEGIINQIKDTFDNVISQKKQG